jgi:hypothetical protein
MCLLTWNYYDECLLLIYFLLVNTYIVYIHQQKINQEKEFIRIITCYQTHVPTIYQNNMIFKFFKNKYHMLVVCPKIKYHMSIIKQCHDTN